jgi:Na+/phosphate symporter
MVNKGASMSQKMSMLNNIDNESISKYKDRSIKHHIDAKLEFSINIAGTDFDNIEEAIIHAYRCGLASINSVQSKKTKEAISTVDQDELYRILKKSHSMEHKADFLREIAKEWFPLELHEKKIKTVNIELNGLADFLEK